MHPIRGHAEGIEGVIEAEVLDGQLDLTAPVRLRLVAPVARLKSGNPLYDEEMQRRVDARHFPTIAAEAREVWQLDASGRYGVRGELTFHGITQPVEGELRITAPDERTLIIEGEHTFDVRDFGVTPPRILLLRVHPDVKARIHLIAEREVTESA